MTVLRETWIVFHRQMRLSLPTVESFDEHSICLVSQQRPSCLT